MTTLAACVDDNATCDPDALFCTFLAGEEAEQITADGLLRGARAYARAYHLRGVGAGDVVIVILRHSPHLFYSFVGALLVGAIPSFMPFPTPKQRVDVYWRDHAQLFARIGPRLVVTYAENVAAAQAALAGSGAETLVAADGLLENDERQGDWPRIHAAPSDVACLQHSSGTTGRKKGVMLTHQAIIGQIMAYGGAIRLTQTDRIISWLPLYHDMGFIACFLTSLVRRIPLIALDPFEWVARPQLLLDAIERYRPTLAWLPNFAFAHLVNAVRPDRTFDLSSMRAFINCSEPCKPQTFERFARRYLRSGVDASKLQVCYAMAENVFAVTQTDLDCPPRTLAVDWTRLSYGTIVQSTDPQAPQLISSGKTIDGVRVEIRGPDQNALPAGQSGEIYVRSPFALTGYYRDPKLTASKVRDSWYATGDLGALYDGELFVTGRIDDLLIINGRNIHAHEIEAVVEDVPGVLPGRIVALGIDDNRNDAMTVIVLAECRDGHAREDSIRREIKQRAIDGLGIVLHTVVLLEPGRLIKTTSGKLSRVRNMELYLQQVSASNREDTVVER